MQPIARFIAERKLPLSASQVQPTLLQVHSSILAFEVPCNKLETPYLEESSVQAVCELDTCANEHEGEPSRSSLL